MYCQPRINNNYILYPSSPPPNNNSEYFSKSYSPPKSSSSSNLLSTNTYNNSNNNSSCITSPLMSPKSNSWGQSPSIQISTINSMPSIALQPSPKFLSTYPAIPLEKFTISSNNNHNNTSPNLTNCNNNNNININNINNNSINQKKKNRLSFSIIEKTKWKKSLREILKKEKKNEIQSNKESFSKQWELIEIKFKLSYSEDDWKLFEKKYKEQLNPQLLESLLELLF